jgi:hypothetical protein
MAAGTDWAMAEAAEKAAIANTIRCMTVAPERIGQRLQA